MIAGIKNNIILSLPIITYYYHPSKCECSLRESNPQLQLRRLLLYPFNYENKCIFLPYDSINHFYAITTFVPFLFQSEKSASTPVQLVLNITKYAKKLHLSNLHKQKQIAITLSGYHYLFIH